MARRARLVAAAMALVLAVMAVREAVGSITASSVRVIDAERLPAIIIDAGHGGMDGGAVSTDLSVLEKDINLRLALNLRDLFTACGFQVVMTREDDRSIHDEGVTGAGRQKTSDLHNRLAIVEGHSPGAILLSIHQNKFRQASSHGAQIFYSPNHEQSGLLAERLQRTIIGMVQPENTRGTKKAEDNLYLMWKAQCPAVLIECGFLSNPEDTGNLQDAGYQKRLCFAILSSVLAHLGLEGDLAPA
jgi:N-acetylmuramoyl-L-alanine amidase